MADYKDIITGTLSSLVGKAKEFAQSDTVSQFVGKVKDTAENNTVRGIYDQGTSRAKIYGKIAKLTLEVNGEHQELNRVYTEIGKLYYEQAKDAPVGFFTSLFSQARDLTDHILSKEDEIQSLKDALGASAESDPDIDVEIGEFEDIVNATAEDGAATDKDD